MADLSASGFSVGAGLDTLRLRQVYNGYLVFKVEGVDIAIDVNFVPRSFDALNDRCGCEFQNLGHREFSALRYLITASLSGEVVSASDVLKTLSREDVPKAQKGKGRNEPAFVGMPRAMVGSLAVMLVALFVISFVTSALSNIYFVNKAESEAGAPFDAPEWSNGNDLVGGETYSVGQIDETSVSIGATDPLSIEAGTQPAGVYADPLWTPPLQKVVVPEAVRNSEGETPSKAR